MLLICACVYIYVRDVYDSCLSHPLFMFVELCDTCVDCNFCDVRYDCLCVMWVVLFVVLCVLCD